MGKKLSKQDTVQYYSNAHSNPVCQMEEDIHRSKSDLTNTSDSLLNSERSLSISNESNRDFSPIKCPQAVLLPPECTKEMIKDSETEEKPEKGEGEKSEKEEKMQLKKKNMLDCDDLQCFTVYEIGPDKTVTHVDKALAQSYDALRKSLKMLPPNSGNHTLKVHLAISVEGENDESPPEKSLSSDNTGLTEEVLSSPNKLPSEPSLVITCNHNGDTPSAVYKLAENTSEVINPAVCNTQTSDQPKQVKLLPSEAKISFSPSTRQRRHCKSLSHHKRESQSCPNSSERTPQDHCKDSRCCFTQDCGNIEVGVGHHHSRRFEQCSENAMGEDCDLTKAHGAITCDLCHIHPELCSCIPGRTISCSKSQPCGDHYHRKKNGHGSCKKPQSSDHHTQLKLLQKAKDNSLNISHNLGELLKEKLDWEHCYRNHPHHKRSKSYDLYNSLENSPIHGLSSPKFRHHKPSFVNNSSLAAHLKSNLSFSSPTSPARHHKYRHREQEQEHHRLPQQLPLWTDKKSHRPSNSEEKVRHCEFLRNYSHKSETNKKHDCFHHHHEHIHHHYHYYIDS